MRTLLSRLTSIVMLINLTYSCNKDPNLNSSLEFEKNQILKSKLRVKKSKEEKEKKAKGYADFIKSITVPMGQEESGYNEGHFFNEFQKAKKNKENFLSQKANVNLYNAYTDNITWEEKGPANVPGRLRQIAIHPTNKNLWYIGTVGGGVWKTEDAGSTFTNLTDFKIPNLATSFVVLSAANPSTIYAGTGEPFNGVGMISGIGIVKSTDQGENWSILENTTQMGSIARMFISQTDEKILVVATTSGVYKTTDGGISWTQTYADGSMQDLKAAPSDNSILYAFDDSNSTIIKSTDQGNTWNTVYTPTIGDSRIELAISYQTPDKVYGSVYTGNNRDEVIVSSDGGTTWSLAPENPENLALYSGLAQYMGGQGWYDNTINVHPTDDNVIYLGGVNLFKSTLSEVNGSLQKLTQPITDVYGSFFPQTGKNTMIHPDNHTIEYIHGDNGQFQLIVGNDGGIAISNMGTDPGFAEGDWITGRVNGLNNTQFYGADKQNGVDRYIAGAQDNGTFVSPENPNSATAHNFVIGGDGFECVWNYDDPNKVLGASQYNGLAISNNGGVSFTRNGAIRDGGPFVSRFANAKNNADVVFALNSKSGVYKTSDFGQNWTISPIDYVVSGNRGDVAVSTPNPAIVWAGKAGGTLSNGTQIPLFVSTDEGETFNPVYPNHTGLAYVSGIETHSTDPNTAYLLMSVRGHSKIMRTEDLGQTWEDITGFAGDGSPSTNGFPDVPTYSLISIPNTDVLWAGTEIGVFQSLNNGATWEYLDENIPAVSVWDMKIVNDEIVISTYGRGLWTASIPDLIGYEPPAYFKAPKITNGHQVWGQNTINFTYDLSSPYDETKIFINGEVFETLTANTDKQTGLTKEISLPAYIPEVTIQLISTKGEETRNSTEVTIPLINFQSITEEHIASFETKPNLLGYSFETPLDGSKGFQWIEPFGWSTGGFIINENLYYRNDSQYIAMTPQPIFIRGDETSKLDYIDIALVEPGDDRGLWDYVVVEASKDGENWIELTEKYDANKHEDWLEAYIAAGSNGKFTANESQYKQTIIDLNQYFKNGDLVLIRFKLVSDASATNWGWFLDEIKIQENIPTEGADLTPTAMTINVNPLIIGQNTDFSFTISNVGSQDATPTTANLYYSTNEILDETATLIGSHTVNALAAGVEETYNESFIIPETIKEGQYYLHYKVDPDNTITELMESNNSINQMTHIGSVIDLTPTAMTINTNPLTIGQNADFSFTISNIGNKDASDTTASLYYSTSEMLDNTAILIGSHTVNALVAGTEETYNESFIIPETIKEGQYYFFYKVDADDTTTEFNEDNNITYQTASVISVIDLTPTAMTINTDPLIIGQNADFSFTISNIGSKNATQTTASLYYSTSEMLDNTAILIGSHTVNSLAIGAEETYNESFIIPETIKEGQYYFFYKVDADDTTTEFNEDNNITYQTASVISVIDLTPTVMIINTDPLTIGQNADFSFTISNIGSKNATQTTASLYYSTSEMLDNTATLIGSHTVNALAVGAEETYNKSFTIPSTVKTGNYYFHYKVDPDNTINELVKSNNFINQKTSIVPITKNTDNFIIKVENETCENQDNGSINITAKETLNYTYTISSDSLSEEGTFTSVLSFDDLPAGTYTLCFGLEDDPNYKQCFDLVVGEPSNLLATTTVNKSNRTVTVTIKKGTAPYNITLNGRTYSINTNSIDLPLIKGSNHISVASDIVCEGTMIDTINTEQLDVKVYPNPVINQLFATIPSSYTLKQIPVQIYTANGLLVLNNIYTIRNNTVELNTSSLGSGLYFVKIGNLKTVKIIKK